jgi:cholesterol transport system auxiliary component
MRATLAGLALIALLPSCSLGPQSKGPIATYDFGVDTQAAPQRRITPTLLVPNVVSPSWLDSPAIVYRLAYQEAGRPQIYAFSRWTAPPAALLSQRLRARLAIASNGGVIAQADSARADHVVNVDLEEFSQIFDTAQSSRGVVRARVSLISSARRSLSAQKVFSVERPAASADANGGARALAEASEELVAQVIEWLAANPTLK